MIINLINVARRNFMASTAILHKSSEQELFESDRYAVKINSLVTYYYLFLDANNKVKCNTSIYLYNENQYKVILSRFFGNYFCSPLIRYKNAIALQDTLRMIYSTLCFVLNANNKRIYYYLTYSPFRMPECAVWIDLQSEPNSSCLKDLCHMVVDIRRRVNMFWKGIQTLFLNK